MTPGIGDRLKKIAKGVSDAERALQETNAALHGRRPPSSMSSYLSPSATPSGAPGSAATPAVANARCGYCGTPVAQRTPKCPNCNAPM